MKTILLKSGTSFAIIESLGAYLSELRLGTFDVLKKSNDGIQTHGGCAVLIPFANRVRNATYTFEGKEYHMEKNDGANAIHGLCRNIDWSVDGINESSATLSCTLENKGYPAELLIKLNFILSDLQLKITFAIENVDDASAPLVVGLHPYFLYSGEWNIMGSGKLKRLNVVDDYFPDGTFSDIDVRELGSSSAANMDSCFLMGPNQTIRLGDHSIKIEGEKFPYFQLYNGKYCEGKSVAFEPMTGAPDAFNNKIGLKVLEPHESAQFSISFACSTPLI
ncbi:MAG: aldose 1-epimerase [Thermoplasmatales archaeon]|nr:aldose 1-epimerase [Thermoplasmatales archaeon]